MWKWALAGVLSVFLLALAGCGWLFRLVPTQFPDEPLPGWAKGPEAAFYTADLPPEASGALGAAWRRGEAWLWAQVIAFPDPATAQTRFSQETAPLSDAQDSGLGDEGVELVHPQSGLVLELFRVGARLVLVGSLAADPEDAPPAEEVRRAARALLGKLPEVPAAEAGPPPQEACDPPEETPHLKVLEVPLFLDGMANGTVVLVLEVAPIGAAAGLCRYRLDLYLKCIELGPEDGDPGLRGPGDLFLAGTLSLPCGELGFLTGEVAELPAGGSVAFPGKGLLLASRECLAPCGLQNVPINLNLVLRNHNQVPLIDLLAAFFWGLARAQPQARPLWETAEGLSRTYGPEAGEPEDPQSAAEGVPGTPLGEGENQTDISFPGAYLNFEMTATVHGECEQISEDTVRCTAVAGEEGQAELVARVDPPAYQVTISAVELPPWAAFTPVSGYGIAQTVCTFVPPSGAVGGVFEFRFRAMTAYGLAEDLRLVLEVVAPEEPG